MTDTTDTGASAPPADWPNPITSEPKPAHLSDGNGRFGLTTLGDLGPMLPMGVEVNGKFVKEIDTKPWRFKEEKEMGAYREANKGLTLGGFVTYLIGTMMTRIGPHVFTDATTGPERTMAVNQLYLGDVLYSYMYLRKTSLGKDVDSVLGCPICELKNQRVLDLDGLDVAIVDDPAKLIHEVELHDGVRIFGEIRKLLTLRPPTWMVMQNPIMFTDNMALRTAALINECIIGAEGLDDGNVIVITEPDMDEMSKRDFEMLSTAIETSPGPRMVVELQCSRCKRETLQLIDWAYDSFFSTASPSRRGKT